MFNKINEFLAPKFEQSEPDIFVKKYSYSSELGANDIVQMIADSNHTIDRILLFVDDEYSYGSGTYDVEGFLEAYKEAYASVDRVHIFGDDLGCDITISDKEHIVSLLFKNVKEMPATELSDIIQEKNEYVEDLKNE